MPRVWEPNSAFYHCFAHLRRVVANLERVVLCSNAFLHVSSSFLVIFSLKLVFRLEIEFPQLVMSSEASLIFIHCLSNSSRGVMFC